MPISDDADRRAKEHVDRYFAEAPRAWTHIQSLSPEQRHLFNQGKDCATGVLVSWIQEGGGIDPTSMIELDRALSAKLGFTPDGRPLEEGD